MNTFTTTIAKRIANSKNRFWEPADFDRSPSRVLHVLGEMVEAGELRRIRRGLYWRGTATPLGMSPPPLRQFSPRWLGKLVSDLWTIRRPLVAFVDSGAAFAGIRGPVRVPENLPA